MDYFDLFGKLFTPQQQVALGIITLGVAILTKVFSVVWFGFFKERRLDTKKAKIWLFAFVTGLLAGAAGYEILNEPKLPLWFWLFSGFCSGGIAAGVFLPIFDKIANTFKKNQ